jgi:hypothetical protein
VIKYSLRRALKAAELPGGIGRRKSDISRDWKSDFRGVLEKYLLRLWCHRFVFCSLITQTAWSSRFPFIILATFQKLSVLHAPHSIPASAQRAMANLWNALTSSWREIFYTALQHARWLLFRCQRCSQRANTLTSSRKIWNMDQRYYLKMPVAGSEGKRHREKRNTEWIKERKFP